jgi:hypothetical protein
MKITGTGPVQTAAPRRRTASAAAGGAFSSAMAAEIGAARNAGPAAEVSATSALFAVQEVDDPLSGRKKAVLRGEDLLDRLDEIRHGLLFGAIPKERLSQLLSMIRRQQERVTDSGLRDVLADIELRAQVELAKLGQLG